MVEIDFHRSLHLTKRHALKSACFVHDKMSSSLVEGIVMTGNHGNTEIEDEFQDARGKLSYT